MKKILALAATIAGAIWLSRRRTAAQPDPWAAHSDSV